MRKPPPLSPEVEALLAPHRAVLPLAPSVEARAIARAAAVAESPAPATLRAPWRPLWVFAAAAAAVLVLGAGAYAARVWRDGSESPKPGRVAVVASAAATESRPRAVAASAAEIEAPPAPIAPPVRRIASKPSATTARPTNAELQLLRLARQDLTSGDFAGALAATGEHARRFRNGILVEEREALRVKSLAGLGRIDEARQAAARFHARFPHSVLLSTFERMTEPDR